ncbi:DUF350 domain-containing protein [Reichenbachiella versicolor]|uniref:DUF350 domain-containing protein n=1 Tax=Reichenbachiella versicolor TaxID=1821036 RepID=UPI000D6DE4E8|nr:DUF350 domain-containing protein [Reichenbachiella versicolor]
MNSSLAILGLVEIISALSIGVVILAMTYKLVKLIGQRFYHIQEQENLAYSIYTAAILYSVGYLVSGVIQPLMSSYRLSSADGSAFEVISRHLGYGFVFIAIAYVFALVIGLLSTILYSKITPIKEFEEIIKNNIGVSIVVSVIIITLTLMTRSGVELLIESVIPYPQLPPR